MIRLLFNSTRQRGRLALDSAEGHTLSSGQRLSVKQGVFWIPGIVEGGGASYVLIPDYDGWSARIPLQSGMMVQDGTTLEENYPERESEQKPMSTREEQYEALYGPLAKFSEYKRGERIRYRLDNQQETGGVILWICEPGEIAGKQQPTCYIVQNDLVGGFPDTIYQSDIIQ